MFWLIISAQDGGAVGKPLRFRLYTRIFLDELGLEKVLHWFGKEQLSNVCGTGNHVQATESNVSLPARNSAAGCS